MKRKSSSQIYRAYQNKMKVLLKGSSEKAIYQALSNGKNSYLRMDRMQSSSFDRSWIDVIEGVIFDLGDIINNPRLSTKQTANITPVELARKTNAKSVQHLASHTQYIKEIDDYGNVIPSKIMTIANEDDYHTYENRFIATFIRFLVLFIEKRYEIVAKNAKLMNEEILMFKNESNVDGTIVEVETKVKISYRNDDHMTLTSNAYVARIEKIREYIQYFYKSPFMRKFKTEKNVRNPIQQTNIIRKNPKYHHCYEVYRFIEKYDRLGVNYKVAETYGIFSDKEIEEINQTLFANYVTLKGKNIPKKNKRKEQIYKPKILTSIDDEKFIYGPLVNTPISFVRADAYYRDYLESKIYKDLPKYPTKEEMEYFDSEFDKKRKIKEEEEQADTLLKRKNKEIRSFEKSVQEVLNERAKAKNDLDKKQQALIAKENEEKLNVARKQIVTSSIETMEQSVLNKAPTKVSGVEKKYREPVIQKKGTNEENKKEKKKVVKKTMSIVKRTQKSDTPLPDVANVYAEASKEKYVVMNKGSYFQDNDTFSSNIEDAKIFEDILSANKISKKYKGKVVKL